MQVTSDKLIAHPLEEAFDIEPHTTFVECTEFVPDPVVEPPEYDEKDREIDTQLETIYTIALGQATVLSDEVERVEGKYKARLGEVTAGMLTTALAAVREKAALKMHKDKLTPASTSTHTVNNNLVVADRNEILRLLADKNKAQ